MPCHYGTASAFGKLAIECVDTPVELLPLSPDVRKKQAYPRRYPQGVIAQYLRKTPPEAEPSLRHRDPTLEKKTADLVDQCGAVPNQAFAGAMRIVGRPTASAIASASRSSFLFDLT